MESDIFFWYSYFIKAYPGLSGEKGRFDIC